LGTVQILFQSIPQRAAVADRIGRQLEFLQAWLRGDEQFGQPT